MSEKILVIFAHPLFEKSRVNKMLAKQCKHHHVVFHDLYEMYPDFNIDVHHEQKALLKHDIIIWHHPVYWYSCPPLLKQWIDMVLEVGWAYGPGGSELEGKKIMQVVTTGSAQEAYTTEGYHEHTLREFFLPFEKTVKLCQMTYLPPFVTHGTHRIKEEEIKIQSKLLEQILTVLQSDSGAILELQNFNYANDYLKIKTS